MIGVRRFPVACKTVMQVVTVVLCMLAGMPLASAGMKPTSVESMELQPPGPSSFQVHPVVRTSLDVSSRSGRPSRVADDVVKRKHRVELETAAATTTGDSDPLRALRAALGIEPATPVPSVVIDAPRAVQPLRRPPAQAPPLA
jgi:hypothetical protein